MTRPSSRWAATAWGVAGCWRWWPRSTTTSGDWCGRPGWRPSGSTWPPSGAGRSPEVAEAADALYDRLVAAGVEVLYDDRDVSPGVKFADADLLGVPVRLVVGAKGVARGVVEWRSRATGEERELALTAPVEALAGPDPARPARRHPVTGPGGRVGPGGTGRPGQGPTGPRCAAILFTLPFGWGVVTLTKRGRTAHAFVLVGNTSTGRAGQAGRRVDGPETGRTATDDDITTGEEAAQMVQDLFPVLQPVVAAAGLELVDVEMRSGVLQVTVDRAGGVDLEALTDANRAVSALLDDLDPIPGRYSLEVSSPGSSGRCAPRPTSPRRWARR